MMITFDGFIPSTVGCLQVKSRVVYKIFLFSTFLGLAFFPQCACICIDYWKWPHPLVSANQTLTGLTFEYAMFGFWAVVGVKKNKHLFHF